MTALAPPTGHEPDQEAALLATIMEAHWAAFDGEDVDTTGPRLVYADWLEERGDVRGEFIRVQVELAKWDDGFPRSDKIVLGDKTYTFIPTAALRARERELLEQHGAKWAAAHLDSPNIIVENHEWGKIIDGPRFTWSWSKGFVSRVELSLAAWIGHCIACAGTGYYFIERNLTACQDCSGTGRVNALGPLIVAACPMEAVVFGGKEPDEIQSDGKDQFCWYSRDNVTRSALMRNTIPIELLRLMVGCYRESEDGWELVVFPSLAAANEALSRAAIRWAKGKR